MVECFSLSGAAYVIGIDGPATECGALDKSSVYQLNNIGVIAETLVVKILFAYNVDFLYRVFDRFVTKPV